MEDVKMAERIIALFSGYPYPEADDQQDIINNPDLEDVLAGMDKNSLDRQKKIYNELCSTPQSEKLDPKLFMFAVLHYKAIKEHRRDDTSLLKLTDLTRSFPNYFGMLSIQEQKEILEILKKSASMYYYMKKNIQGNSQKIHEAKVNTWKACFGKNLSKAVSHSSAIRSHNILLRGDSGVGKQLFAEAIMKACFWKVPKGNNRSPANQKAASSLNVAAISPQLVESELFGAEAGAFTGADKEKIGLIEHAHGKVLFLDEIGDMEISAQSKLLRTLGSDTVRPVGGTQEFDAKVRFVSATNKDIRETPESFRSDLYYRIANSTIYIPTLISRKDEDLELLFEYFYTKMSPGHSNTKSEWKKFNNIHLNNDWPGNVRQLKSEVESFVLGLSEGTVEYETKGDITPEPIIPLSEYVTRYVREVYKKCDGNKSKTARKLEIDINTVRSKLDPANAIAPKR